MKALVIGSGGREHCIAWKLKQSSQCDEVLVLPGNPGMNQDDGLRTVSGEINADAIQQISIQEQIDLIVIGPEAPLCQGLATELRSRNLVCFGPDKEAAKLESSKIFSKELMIKANVPTTDFKSFENSASAQTFIAESGWNNFVVKLSGLAAGKGVFVCQDSAQAKDAVKKIMDENLLGVEDRSLLIEKTAKGKEVSAFVVCDGVDYQFLGYACDYKRIRDGDSGPNTGGMGTYSPVDWVTKRLHQNVIERVVEPTLHQLKNEGNQFQGILFIGLMVEDENNFNVLEYNVRLGDPETQVLLPLYEGDLFELFFTAAKGKITKQQVTENTGAAVHVVCSAYGYPGTEGVPVRKGDQIEVSPELLNSKDNEDSKVFFAGVKEVNGKLQTNGGRVLGITCLANDKSSARQKAYSRIEGIRFQDMFFRKDIAK